MRVQGLATTGGIMMTDSKAQQPRRKHVPMRTCVACRQQFEKRSLVRLVYNAEGLQVDETGKASGRGAYLCTQPSCWQRAAQTDVLNRALHVTLSAGDKQRLLERQTHLR